MANKTNVTNKQIREYFGHNRVECKVRISRDGNVYRYGSTDEFDRSKDSWAFIGYRDELALEVAGL